MTRVLSELLGANVTQFGLMVKRLERAAGQPSIDIRLTSEITQLLNQKITELGLDPRDTACAELYAALNTRLRHDEQRVREMLGMQDKHDNVSLFAAMQRYLETESLLPQAFVIKQSVIKRFMKKAPPKKVMKRLGYRSLDSMLKHESAAELYVVALHCESAAWQRKFYDLYQTLRPGDFETRQIEITVPKAKRWSGVAEEIAHQLRTHVAVGKELGVIVLLPAPNVPGIAISTFVSILQAVNTIRSTSSYLKLYQVRPDFGKEVRHSIGSEPMTEARLLTEQVPWKVVHQYYAKFTDMYSAALFEPHIQRSDLEWVHPDEALAKMHPSLSFWRDTRYLSLKLGHEHVSLNISDAIINFCNHIPYTNRFLGSVRATLWHELMLRYLNLQNIEEAIARQLQPEFAMEPVETE